MRIQNTLVSLVAVVMVTIMVGCQPATTSDSQYDPAETADPAVPGDDTAQDSEPGTDNGAQNDDDADEPDSGPADAAAATPTATRDAEPSGSVVKAQAGVGKKGRSYGGGLISEPARQYFGIRQRLVFQIQIPQALKTFKALQGKGPASHDEFMEKVIQQNGISLPELPQGESYEYDVQQEQLMVRRPSR